MEKQKKSYGKTALIVLLLIVTIASLVLATYAWAKYTSQKEGTATAQVAKWDVDATFDHSNYQKVQSFTHVLGNKLAPGTSGQFDITIKPQDTEVDFTYEIILEKVEAVEEGGIVPAHLHFYTEKDHNEDALIGEIVGTGDAQKSDGNTVDSKLKGEITVSSKSDKTVTIFWDWPYQDPNNSEGTVTDGNDTKHISEDGSKLDEGKNGISDYDDQDTLDGQKASQIKVTYKVVMIQIEPEASSKD